MMGAALLAFEHWKRWRIGSPAPPEEPETLAAPETAAGEELDPELAIERRMLRLAGVDPERFEFFYRKYYGRILRFFYHRTLHRETAEDLTGETFTRALDRLGRFRWQGVTFGGWLYRIALNLWRQHRRRLGVLTLEQLPENVLPEEILVSDEPDPLTRLSHVRRRRRLLRCLERLDETSREDVMLHYLDGLTHREIAAIRGVPPGTVRSRVSRAVECLRRMMREQEEEA